MKKCWTMDTFQQKFTIENDICCLFTTMALSCAIFIISCTPLKAQCKTPLHWAFNGQIEEYIMFPCFVLTNFFFFFSCWNYELRKCLYKLYIVCCFISSVIFFESLKKSYVVSNKSFHFKKSLWNVFPSTQVQGCFSSESTVAMMLSKLQKEPQGNFHHHVSLCTLLYFYLCDVQFFFCQVVKGYLRVKNWSSLNLHFGLPKCSSGVQDSLLLTSLRRQLKARTLSHPFVM